MDCLSTTTKEKKENANTPTCTKNFKYSTACRKKEDPARYVKAKRATQNVKQHTDKNKMKGKHKQKVKQHK